MGYCAAEPTLDSASREKISNRKQVVVGDFFILTNLTFSLLTGVRSYLNQKFQVRSLQPHIVTWAQTPVQTTTKDLSD